MANLSGAETFDNVVRIETTDFVTGGVGGKANQQAQELTNRTAYLKGKHDRMLFTRGYVDVSLTTSPFDYAIDSSHYGKLVRIASNTSNSANILLPAVSGVPDGTIIGFENAAGGTKNVILIADGGSENFKASIGNVNYSDIRLHYLNTAVIMKVAGLTGGWLLLEHDNYEVGHLKLIPDIVAIEKYGWLKCDGSSYSSVSSQPYRRLFDKIGTTYGSGSGTFNVPNIAPIVVSGTNHYYYIKY